MSDNRHEIRSKIGQGGASKLNIPDSTSPPKSEEPTPAPEPSQAEAQAAQGPVVVIPRKQGMSGAGKGVIAALLLVSIIIAGIVLYGKQAEKAKIARLVEITAPFKDLTNPPTEIKLTKSDITLLLDTLVSPEATEKGVRGTYQESLSIGKTTDGSNLDDLVAKYATSTAMSEDARIKLFEVLGKRSQPAALTPLINFARSTNVPESGQAALKATEKMATVDHFDQLLGIVTLAQHDEVQRAAVKSLKAVIKRTIDKSSFSTAIISSFRSNTESDVREGLLHLLGAAGGEDAAELINTHLNGKDVKLQLAAIAGLREWPDSSQFKTLHTFVENEKEGLLRRQAFGAMIQFLTEGPEVNDDDLALFWRDTATLALEEAEQIRVVNAMVNQKSEWALGILDHFINRGRTDRIKARAEDGKEVLKKRLVRASNGE